MKGKRDYVPSWKSVDRAGLWTEEGHLCSTKFLSPIGERLRFALWQLVARWASIRLRSTPTPTAMHAMCAKQTSPIPLVQHQLRKVISTSMPLWRLRYVLERKLFTLATVFSQRMPHL